MFLIAFSLSFMKYEQLRIMWKELKPRSQINYRSEFTSFLIMIPVTAITGVIFTSISSKYYRWNRYAIERDEYFFTISSKGQCYVDRRILTESMQFISALVALVIIFVVHQNFATKIISKQIEDKYIVSHSKQIFIALTAHGIMNIATVSYSAFIDRAAKADLTRPYVILMVFPYLWFIVVHSLRSDISYPSNTFVDDIVIGNDNASDLSSVTMSDMNSIQDREVMLSTRIRTLNDVHQLQLLSNVGERSTDCSLISEQS